MTEHAHHTDSSDLREFLGPMWTRKWMILLVVVTATALTYVLSERKPDVFKTSTRVFLTTSELEQALAGASTSTLDDRTITDQAALLQTPGVAREVAKRLNFPRDPNELLGRVSAAPEGGSDFLIISATGGTAQGAAKLANAFAQAFIEGKAKNDIARVHSALRTAQRQLGALGPSLANKAQRDALQEQIRSLRAIANLPSAAAQQTNKAVPPGSRSSPQPRRSALFGFGLSLVFAILGAYGLERFDRRVRRLNQVAPAFHVPVLAALPSVPAKALHSQVAGALEPTHPFREVVRGLRTNLQLAHPDDPLRTLLVTSAGESEGKSTLVCHLARAYQEAGLRVVVVESDLRRPALAALMKVPPTPGLTDVLAGECDLADALQVVDIPAPIREAVAVGAAAEDGPAGRLRSAGLLTVLTSGAQPPDPATVLGARRMQRVLESLREASDLVIIDSTPLLAVADGLPLLPMVDGALLVARLGVAHRSSGRRIKEVVDRIPGATVLGVVANDVPGSDAGGYGYGYGYGYGDGDGSAGA